ncbi:DUF4148 domain-containing protein [Allopusillimonas ginsengisoli]|uniref:DUF4148 domain-containing protein n=1 Tax=Allopusillimonas ginsengisoli TaxID=453575 RepID=UPI001431AD34|nr:DUF4148 domain-containing protein [Allopusillimonas ginsengisoli]
MSVRSKTLFALFALAVAAPVTSFAQWVPDNTEQGGTEVYDWPSVKTRAQVLEELEQAKADPAWATRQGEATGRLPQEATESQLTRAQVKQELETQTAKEVAYLESLYTGA